MICRPCEIARMLPIEVACISKIYDVPLNLIEPLCDLKERCRVWHNKCNSESCDCNHMIEVENGLRELQDSRPVQHRSPEG